MKILSAVFFTFCGSVTFKLKCTCGRKKTFQSLGNIMMRELLMASLLLLTDCLHVQQAKETTYGPYFFLVVVKSKLINGLLGESTLSLPS